MWLGLCLTAVLTQGLLLHTPTAVRLCTHHRRFAVKRHGTTWTPPFTLELPAIGKPLCTSHRSCAAPAVGHCCWALWAKGTATHPPTHHPPCVSPCALQRRFPQGLKVHIQASEQHDLAALTQVCVEACGRAGRRASIKNGQTWAWELPHCRVQPRVLFGRQGQKRPLGVAGGVELSSR